MKITRIHLENIRSYEDQTVEFPEGTILIHGENGAGKTSLLMGLFGGLFLSNITNVDGNDFNVGDLVRRGEDKGRVELDFVVDDNEYSVEWEMPGADSGSQSKATLSSPVLSDPVSGIRDVQQEVTNLLGMNEDDFSSSAYVQQGEIDRLIEANDRGAMIDSLLGLDQIEEYIERAKMTRRGARRTYERCQERRRGQEANLDDYDHDEDGYIEEIQRLKAEIDEQKDLVENHQDHIDETLVPRLNDFTDKLDRYDTLSERLSTKQEQIDEAESEKVDARKTKQESDDAITEHKSVISDLRDEIETLDDEAEYDLSSGEGAADALNAVQDDLLDAQQEKNTLENEYNNVRDDLMDAKSDLGDVNNDIEEARTQAEEKELAIEDAEGDVESYRDELCEQLRDLADTLEEYDVETNFGTDEDGEIDIDVATDALVPLARERIPERREQLSDEINEVTGEIGRLETKVETLNDQIEEFQELGEAGECPKCGQAVEEAHVDEEIDELENERDNVEAKITSIEEDKKQLQRRHGQLSGIRNTVNDAIDFYTDTLVEARERVEDLRGDREDITEEIDELETEESELHDLIDDLETTVEEREAAFEEAEARMESIADSRETVKQADAKYDAINDCQTKIEQEQQTISYADDRIENLDDQLDAYRDEKESIEDELGDLDPEELRERKATYEDEIESHRESRDEAQSRVEDLRGEVAGVETTLDNLRDLQENIAELEHRERWADSVQEDIEHTLSIYNEVQSDLRETYLGYLNEYANDIFKDIYKNSSYQQVRITEEHDETYDTYDYDIQLLRDDGTMEDPANASGGERAVVNLALRAGIYRLIAQIRGAGGTLPPFILDEPTTFLDEGHVGQLEQMLDTINEWDVAQVFVVSHDESLIHGADHECLVTKDEGSASQVEMRLAGQDYEGGDGTEVALSDGGSGERNP
jgi:exonuclease SbcC